MAFRREAAICATCITDSVLSGEIERDGTRRTCVLCHRRRRCVDLGVVVDRLDDIYQSYFVPGSFLGSDRPQGQYPEEIVAELLGCDTALSEWIVKQLAAEENHAVLHDGGRAMYDTTARYEAIEADAWWERDTWEAFEDHIKYERRFFGPGREGLLNELLGDLPTLIARFGIEAEVALSTQGPSVFRARTADGRLSADQIAADAPRSLGPPPVSSNLGGRMNPPGIPAFYGAFDRNTCLHELRPIVGQEVVSAEFRATRDLRLLNVPAFSECEPHLSRFAADYLEVSTRILFLRSFHRIISRPVLPTRLQLDYLPTQAVAEFLASQLGVDGLVYFPAQGGGDPDGPTLRMRNNLVLFSAPFLAAEEMAHRRVEARPTELRPSVVPSVFSEVPRSPCLEMVPGSVEVHRVTGVDVQAHWRPILDLEADDGGGPWDGVLSEWLDDGDVS